MGMNICHVCAYRPSIAHKLHFACGVWDNSIGTCRRGFTRARARISRHACKTLSSHCKVFRQQCFAGKLNQRGPAPFHRRRLWFNAHPNAGRALTASGMLHCRLCVALKSNPGIYSGLSLNVLRWRRRRWRHSKRRISIRSGIWLIQLKHQTYRTDWSPSLPYGVKENARWKCQPFSRARGIAFASYERISHAIEYSCSPI